MLDYAFLHKQELELKYSKFIIENRAIDFWRGYIKYDLTIENTNWEKEQFVFIDNEEVVGYISFEISRLHNKIEEISLINFTENSKISIKMYAELNKKISTYFKNGIYKIEFSSIVGSVAEKINNKLIKRINGNVIGVSVMGIQHLGERKSIKMYEVINPKFL